MAQRLLNHEIDKRVRIRLDKAIKKCTVNGIMLFGQHNDYPQINEKLINGSVTAKAVANIYSKFLTGKGFEAESVNQIVIGTDSRGKKITVYNLLQQISSSLSKHCGFYVHCGYDAGLKINNVHLKPFKDIRFAKPDDIGYSAKVCYYENWDRDVDKIINKQINIIKDMRVYDVFNSNESVILSQIKKAGGAENYTGQIYFEFLDNEYFYPLSNFDEVYLDMDTEQQISLYKNRQIRDGFLDKIVFRVAPAGTEEEKDDFKNHIKKFIGPDGDSVLILEDDLDENGEIAQNGSFRIDKIESSVNDKLFENWEKTLANNIRKACKGVPALLIDYEESKLGNTSGEAVKEATNFYNALTVDDRETITRVFTEIFSNSNNPILSQNINWSIVPLSLYSEPIIKQ